MPREIGKIKVTIWGDPDWRELTPQAKALYFYLLTNSTLNYAGVSDWRPGRIAPILGCTREDVEQYAEDLQAAAFIYADENTEEAFVRSYVRHDGLLAHAQLPKAMANAYANISSPEIQRYFVAELRKARDEQPDLKVWGSEQVARILSQPAEDMKKIASQIHPERLSIPAGEATESIRLASQPSGPEPTNPSDTTTTTATPKGEGGSAPRRLPSGWSPTEAHKAKAREKHLNLEAEAEQFRLHADTHGRKAVNWNSAFSMWLNKATPRPQTIPNGRPTEGSWMIPRKAG